MTAPTYPKRPGHFAHKFCRLLAKATVANELGCEGCWLLAVIAHTEDAKGYRSPVLYYNGQLMSFCGFKTEDKLARVRAKLVQAGWLHYAPGRRGAAGRYWVVIPPHELNLWPTDGAALESTQGHGTVVAEGVVVRREYRGDRIRHRVRFNDGTELTSETGSDQPRANPAPQDQVRVSWRASSMHIISSEESS